MLGQVFILLAIFLLVPAAVAIGYVEHDAYLACLRAALIAFALGRGFVHLKNDPDTSGLLGRRNALVLGSSAVVALVFMWGPGLSASNWEGWNAALAGGLGLAAEQVVIAVEIPVDSMPLVGSHFFSAGGF